MFRKPTTHFFVALTAVLFLISTVDVVQDAEAKTKIKHSQVKKARAGDRIYINAQITDDAGVEVTRVYFKWETAKDFNFVPMSTDGDEFLGTLPAPADERRMEYLILVKNGANEVRRSESYTIKIKKSKDRGAVQPGDRINV